MKELFDRHQQKLTDAEDRKVWSAIHDATRGRRSLWKRMAVPVSLLATTTAAAAVVLMTSDTPTLSDRVVEEQTAILDDLEKKTDRDFGAREVANPEDGFRHKAPWQVSEGRESVLKNNYERQSGQERSNASPVPATLPAERPARQFTPPTPVRLETLELSAEEMKNNVPSEADRSKLKQEPADVGRLSERELERLPVDRFAEEAGKKDGVSSQSGEMHSRGGRAGEVNFELSDIPASEPEKEKARRVRSVEAPQTAAPFLTGGVTRESDARSSLVADERVAGKDQVKSLAKKPGPPRRDPITVGGSAPVNGKAIDAMFFQHYGVNPFVDPEDDRFATFSVDVDNASYALTRAYLDRGVLPPREAIRVEEFVNSFKHGYAPPRNPMFADRSWAPSEKGTFAIHLDAAPSPFGKGLTMLRVGLKGREVYAEDRKPANLTFVVDVSGSMKRENRLDLVKQSLFTLLDELNSEDQVSLVVYGSTARILLPPTPLTERRAIESAIGRLRPEGATNAEAGLRKGYAMAERAYTRGCINRVILCSDGVANVGKTGADDILDVIKRQAGEGIYLTTVGFGMGNYNDVLMEQLANKGDGNYFYVDDLKEARKVFVENLTGTLQTIARQTKIQVEFDPETVRRYRLLGYENRDVADRDFRNNKVDAGEVGAGHEVTALFEMKLDGNAGGNLATIRIRYEDPETGRVAEESRVLRAEDLVRFQDTDPTFKMDAAVAEFAEILRHSYWAKDGSLSEVFNLAKDASRRLGRPADLREMTAMVEQAWQLWPKETEDHSYEIRPHWDPDDDN